MALQVVGAGKALQLDVSGMTALPSLHEPSLGERLLLQLGALSGEYLFFIGASLIALLLLSRRRAIAAGAVFALALLWLSFHLPVSLYLESLGADSFAETRGFDLEEARFWVQTLQESVQPDFSIKKFLAYSAVALALFFGLRWLLQRSGLRERAYLVCKVLVALSLVGLSFHQTTAKALAFYLENTEKFHITAAKFNNAPPAASVQGQPLDVTVYIGESTSVMNMGLYGYARPTTPRLSDIAARDRHLVVFSDVFSTHAHTSRSLLEALSFGLDASEAFVPITERQRISVVDVLRSAGLEPRLLSNQGQGGSWDQASSVIFKNSHNTFRSRTKPTNSEAAADRPWDHEFFADQLQALAPASEKPQVVFLHSYAGHGPYHKNIPERFRQPVDRLFAETNRVRLVRDASVSLAQIEEYDAATRYVDHSVAEAIARVKGSARPAALVYFSDHGDAVFAGIGHDSARFRHEMARVPFLIYFNDAAARARPDLLAKYQQLARAQRTATLAQLPSTLLDLLNVRISDAKAVLQTPVMGEPVELPPILVRQTAQGVTFVKLGAQQVPEQTADGLRLIDRTDEDTQRYLAARSPSPVRPVRNPCDATPATFEEMSRNTLVLRCPAAPLHTWVARSH